MGTQNAFKTRQNEKKHGKGAYIKCQMCRHVVYDLTDEQREQLIEVWRDHDVSSYTISSQLNDWGCVTSSSVVVNHRAGERRNCNDRIARGWNPELEPQ